MDHQNSRTRAGVRRTVTVLAVAAVGFGFAFPAAAAGGQSSRAAQSPTHVLDLTSGHNDFANDVDVLAGSSNWVIVESLHSGGRGIYPGAKTLEAIASDGTAHPLQAPAAVLKPDAYKWSLVDDMLTASHSDCCHPGTVYWWNLATNTHGLGHTTSDDDWMFGSSPDGWLYQVNHVGAKGAQVFDQHADGSPTTSMGRAPASGADIVVGSATTGPDGFVVGYGRGTSRGWWFLGWHSSSYTALDLPNPTIFASCGAEAFHAVACVDEDFRHGRSSVLRIPTSGATAISTATVSCPRCRAHSHADRLGRAGEPRLTRASVH